MSKKQEVKTIKDSVEVQDCEEKERKGLHVKGVLRNFSRKNAKKESDEDQLKESKDIKFQNAEQPQPADKNSDLGKGKKSTKKARIWHSLSLLNPKNLKQEVHIYGYNFSWKAHLLLLICSIMGISTIGIIFKLQPLFFTISILAVIFIIPFVVRYMYKQMYEQKRFSDIVTYMEQMLYSFQKNEKIVLALKETSELFEPGMMKAHIEQAIAYIEEGKSESEQGILREALSIIEESYDCTKLKIVHELLANSEEYGGDCENTILIVLKDLEIWKRRSYKLQANKKQSNIDNIISIIVATILCAVALYVLNGMSAMFPTAATNVDIFKVEIIQVSSAIFILLMLLTFIKSSRSLTTNWLKSEDTHDDAYLMDSYDTVINYNDAAERKKSILYAIPFCAAAVVLFIFQMNVLGVISILLAVFMLLQHKTGYNLAKKDVNEAMYLAMPQWFMQIALLLQHNNVQVSLAKSISDAPAVLQKELEELMIRLAENPDKLSSYTDFCKNFDVPEAQSCMKMLHAISESGTGNTNRQIENLIERVNEMQEMADSIHDKNMQFKMKMIFSYPVMGATVKLLIDLTFGMIFMFQMIGNMGGI